MIFIRRTKRTPAEEREDRSEQLARDNRAKEAARDAVEAQIRAERAEASAKAIRETVRLTGAWFPGRDGLPENKYSATSLRSRLVTAFTAGWRAAR